MSKIQNYHLWLADAWEKFVFQGVIDQRVRPEIINSWVRCREFNVDPLSDSVMVLLSAEKFAERKSKQAHLIKVAQPYIKLLSEYAVDSGFIIFLSDNLGTVLILDGDRDELQKQRETNLVEGAIWSEQSAGTNAVGTSIFTQSPLQVVGKEHYCALQHSITCSGAPIYDAEGALLGILNMSGNCNDVNEHTLGMVVACAQAIQNQVRIEEGLLELENNNLVMNTTLECTPNAIITVDKEGIITQLNATGATLLKIEPKRAIGNQLGKILPTKQDLIQLMRNGAANGIEIFIGDDDTARRCNLSAKSIYSKVGQYSGAVIQIQSSDQVDNLVNQVTGAHAQFSFDKLIGQNAVFVQTKKIAQEVAKTNSTVLLLGESGTGKELFAQAIHNDSNRSGAFIAVNCSAIPRSLVESELFGYEAGTFTGANRNGRPGKFERAHNGTIFLDEIGDMPLDLQAVLLRVLQEREVVRVGGFKPIPVNVRVIAATNQDLLEKVVEGNFREDLYYRLNVIALRIPPLRERKDDISLLVKELLPQICARMNKQLLRVSPAVMQILQKYDWPGNVRELENALERSTVIAKGNEIEMVDLSEHLNSATSMNMNNMSLQDIEKVRIEQAIATQRTVEDAAKILGISRSTLYRKMTALEIQKVKS